MALVFTSLILFLLGHSFAGTISARSVELTNGQSDVDADVAEIEDVIASDTVTSEDVLCDVSGCSYDLQLYCLNNGVIVMGSCSLKNLLCRNGERNSLTLAQDWDECFRATYVIEHHEMNADDVDNSDRILQDSEQQDDSSQSLNIQHHSLLQSDQMPTQSNIGTEGDDGPGQASDRVVDLLSDLEDELDQSLE